MNPPSDSASPSHPFWLQVIALVITFLGGGLGGVVLAIHLAPETPFVAVIGMFSFAFPFLVGMQLWLGFAIFITVWRFVRRASEPSAGNQIPSGSIVFLPTSVVLVTFAGMFVGIWSETGFLSTVMLYALLGSLYGTVCWLLARSGFLPFPS